MRSYQLLNIFIALSVTLLALNRVNAASSSNSKSVVKVATSDETQSQIHNVRQTLCDRLSYVQRGKRIRDFERWVREQGGNPKVFSMHGVDVEAQVEEMEKVEKQVALPASKSEKKDPFSLDRMNLNIESLDGFVYFKDEIDESDGKPPSVVQLSLRAAKLSLQFAPVLTTSLVAILSKKFRRDVWYNWLTNCLASSGAAFIKWGQWAATRSDMFPVALCDALENLHNDAPAHSWSFTQQQVEKSLNVPSGSLLKVFKSFDEKPLASGSIAQVHRAELHNGEVVAAKVRHPNVSKLIDMDFRLMTIAASFFDMLPALKGLHVSDSVAQFSHTMAAQAHLNVEAHHLEVLNHNFRKWKTVKFPQPFYASASLILETFERGSIITGILQEYEDDAKQTDPPLQAHDLFPLDQAQFIVTTGVSLYLKMLLMDNLMHADLHPGNIMLRGFESFETGNLQVTLVDAGMVAQLSEEESSTFIGLLTCIGEGNGDGAAEFALQFSSENQLSPERKEQFKKKMTEYFNTNCRGYGTNVDIGEILRGILGLIREFKIRIDANYATLVINVLCIEGLGRRICPAYNVLDASRPLLHAYRRLVYKEDGYTPKLDGSKAKRVRHLMPSILYGAKKRADNATFRQIRTSRKTAIVGGANSEF